MGREEPSSPQPDGFFDTTLKLLEIEIQSRKFVVTDSGYYALVPRDAQEGDILVALVGGNVPFVLRRVVFDEGSSSRKEETLSKKGLETSDTSYDTNLPATPLEDVELSALEDLEAMANGPSYSGTSRGPRYPIIMNQELVLDVLDESVGVGINSDFYFPRQLGKGQYDASWEIVKTTYVHKIMNEKVKKAYEDGRATLQTYLIV